MNSSYYIYYRVSPYDELAAHETVRSLMAHVEAATGIRGRQMQKVGEPTLWMEIYEEVADAARFETALADALRLSGLLRYLQEGSTRHVERFAACA